MSAEDILASVMHTVKANTSWHDSCDDAAAHLVPTLQEDLRVAFPAYPDITVHCKPYAGTGGMECFYVGHYSGLATERGQQLAEDLGLLIVRTGQHSGTAPSSYVWFPICRGRSGWRVSVPHACDEASGCLGTFPVAHGAHGPNSARTATRATRPSTPVPAHKGTCCPANRKHDHTHVP